MKTIKIYFKKIEINFDKYRQKLNHRYIFNNKLFTHVNHEIKIKVNSSCITLKTRRRRGTL